jgi:hypothetical protein
MPLLGLLGLQGAGKEYIGDDIEEMVVAVKAAMQVGGPKPSSVFKNTSLGPSTKPARPAG